MTLSLAALNRRLPGRRAFITGSGSGLGLELARVLAKEGWALGLFDVDLTRLTNAEAELTAAGARVQAFPGDVTQCDELTVAVNSFADNVGGLDLMINNAGVACAGGLLETRLEDWRWIIDINVLGVVHGCRAGVPHLQRGGTGILLNVASAAAFISPPFLTPYNTTKAAVVAISESLAGELTHVGIQVSVAMPSFMQTQLLSTARGPERELEIGKQIMRNSHYTVQTAAREMLLAAAHGDLYIVLPKAMRSVWRLKRWWPQWFTRKFPHMRERAIARAMRKEQDKI
ncbi:MAG: SDR family NAD(P)-dependent oxidoreductase [Candidatus Obscuribacterales bacterium]|nr:SDR family NAD(P)-dependent oxidoreductase [Steroidobacteraceae bacterium]